MTDSQHNTHTGKQKKAQPNIFDRVMTRLDNLQRKHHGLSYPYAVIKKYGDDNAGHLAALMTYYGFLSLFPLLLVATSVINILANNHPEIHAAFVNSLNTYFPIGSEQLQKQVQTNKTGLALLIGIIFTMYGARGIADSIRNALDHAWAIPRVKRAGFPKNILKSFGLLIGAGIGLLTTTTLASFATGALGQSLGYRLIPILITVGILYLIFMYVFLLGTSKRHPRKDIRLGAITAAVGLMILQTVGAYLITHQLRNLQGLYGSFALVLSLIFWVYLQAQVVMYAIEINVVHTYKLWPRSLTGRNLTHADQKAYRLYAEKEAYRPTPEEEIDVTFLHPR